MSIRGRILAAAVLLAVGPLAAAIATIRPGVADDVTELDTRRVESRLQLVLDDLDRRDRHLATLLDALAGSIAADNTFRLAVSGERDDLRDYVRDYAPRQLALMGLDMLLVQDPAGRTVSSGHFREAEGALAPDLPRLLARAPGGRALMAVRTPAGPILAQVRTHSFSLAAETWHLVGGVGLDTAELAGRAADPDLTVVLAWPGGAPLPGGIVDTALASEQAVLAREYALRRAGHVVRRETLTLVEADRLADAWLLVSHNRVSLQQTLHGVNRRLLEIAALAAGAAVLLAVLLAGRISRPLRDLAARARDLDLERLDVRFATGGRDEVGQLARVLDELTGRLRAGVIRLREAEQRATQGEMARQVNHDIRNGLTPLRNVLRHLGEVAEQDPAALGGVWRERRATLDGGLAYLEELAGHYARLSSARSRRLCDLGALVAAVADETAAGGAARGVAVVREIEPGLPPVEADPVSLRRIVDNLLRNALESLPAGGGTVTLAARREHDPDLDEPRLVLAVADTGCGIAEADRPRIFDDFFTTKEGGTGLGLSNVRRLAGDCGARVAVRSEPGRGSVFTVSFPLHDSAGTDP
ncbi:MAG: HAMP domain-containing histidine kinase [Krumholzibacteria bacterium]|nr:HAMP domain-containing histidine kinase [Candidatus Krumholzibacteria bacterium]